MANDKYVNHTHHHYDQSNKTNYNNNSSSVVNDPEYHKPKGLLTALSEIQRYYVIESKASEELPKDYFTFQQIWDFFKIGFKSGFLESLIFATLFPFIQTVYPSFKYYFLNEMLSKQDMLFLDALSYVSLVSGTIFMIVVGKYYEGELTKRAIFSLLNGRSFAFLGKGIFIFFLLIWLQKLSYTHPDFVYSMADFTKFLFNLATDNTVNSYSIYEYYYKYIIPALDKTAKDILISMFIFALLPYLTVFYRGFKRKSREISSKMYYDKY